MILMDRKEINTRFTEAVNRVVLTGQAETQRGIAAEIKTSEGVFSDMLAGRRHLSLEVAVRFCLRYNISADWLLLGKTNDTRSEMEALRERVQALELRMVTGKKPGKLLRKTGHS